jgi:hypothetical protein
LNYDAAVNVILMHSSGREDVPLNEALYREGFLGSLRPFSGLREENFLQVMEAIVALGPHLAGKREWDVRLLEGLWGLVVTARNWGLDPGGMLQRNRLLSSADTQRLRLWVTCIEIAVARLMRGGDPSEGLTYYLEQPKTEP